MPVPPRLDPELRDVFLAEGDELFERIEALVLRLSGGSRSADVLHELGRCFHTLKGAAGSVGLVAVSELIHAVEGELEEAAGDVTDPLIGVLHQALNDLEGVFASLRRGGGCESAALGEEGAVAAEPASTAEAPSVPVPRPHADEADTRHDAGVLPGEAVPPPTRSLAGGDRAGGASANSAQGGSEKPSAPSQPPTSDAAAPEGPVRVPSEKIDELMDLASELITRRGLWSAQFQAMKEFAAAARVCRNRLSATVDRLRDSDAFQRALASPTKDGRRAADHEELAGVLRRLVEQVDDLAVLTESVQGVAGPLADNGDTLARTTLRLWESLQAVRIVPVSGLFQRLTRVAHDAARVEGRQVVVETVGEETGLDRAVQDKAFEPLLHVVRNAVSHGIEPPAQREEAGKPAAGRVTLEAARSGNTLVLSVRDDGRGLDYAAIEAKGRRLGLIAPADRPGVDRLNALIFQSGFSTREEANAVAGRGVGMDVVAREVDRLHGTIEIESESGRGTRLCVRLPARLSLQQVMTVRVDGLAFAVSVDQVELAQPFDPAEVDRSGPTPRVLARGRWVPLVSARGALGLTPDAPGSCPKLLLIREGGGTLAVQVDAIEGTSELVVKPLGPLLAGHPDVSGTGLSVTGEVVLMLNPSGLARRAARVGRTGRPAEGPARPDRPAPVLVVDDSISVRSLAVRRLRALGYEVEEAADGLDALAKLRSRAFGLVVSDLEMPRMDGFELLAELTRLAIVPAVPVVVSSTLSDPETRRKVLALGARGFVPKPVGPDALSALVREHYSPRSDVGAVPVGSP